MAQNDFYTVIEGPKARQRARSEVMRAEFQGIEDGFAALPTRNDLAGGVQLRAEETVQSAPDSYVLVSHYPITELVRGSTVRWFVVHTNRGPCTAQVDATGQQPLVNIDGQPLAGGELVATWPAEMMWDGAAWRLMNSAQRVVSGLSLATALSPQNYQLNVEIPTLTLPAATGDAPPYTYAVAGLPAGLTFDPATRQVTGTPTIIGASTVTYTVTDANTISATFQTQIRVVAVLIVLPDPVDRILVAGTSYDFILGGAQGGTPPFRYEIAGLPPGLLFDVETREVTGTPTQPGVYEVTLSVSDSSRPVQTQTQTFSLTVRLSAPLAVGGALPNRVFSPGSAITPFTLPAATGGVPPYSYILTGLGDGLAFNDQTREVTGNPAVTGDRLVTYRIEDAADSSVERQFTISIEQAGRRYILVHEDRNPNAAEIAAGNSFAPNEQELDLPGWNGNRYIVIAQPADNDDLTSISLAGLGNSISAFEKLATTRTIGGLTYEVWVGLEVQGDPISGETVEVRP